MNSTTLNSVTLEISEDDRLFHYTSTKGLYGVLESGVLWATHFQFLNDAQECRQAERSLEHQLRGAIARKIAALVVNKQTTLPPGMDVKKAASIEATGIVKIMYDVVFRLVDPFVFSAFLCSSSDTRRFQNGELQHWATYGHAGYALQINPKRLRAVIEAEAKKYTHGGFFCSAVEYSDGVTPPPSLREQYDVIEAVAVKLVEHSATGADRTPELDADIESTFIPFVRVVAFIKDKCFEHEREGRIVFNRHKAVPSDRRNHTLKIAIQGAFGVPYVGLFDGELLGAESPIERIIIGPHPERVRRRVSLEAYLASRNLEIAVSESDLPYSPR